MRIEEALRVLPDVEAVAPLRAVLLATARPPGSEWGSGSPYTTIGKREVAPDEMRRGLATALTQVESHLGLMWERYVAALEHLGRGEAALAVAELIQNGRLEQGVGRLTEARAWFQSARGLAEALQDRRPEVDSLLALGQLALYLGFYEDSARDNQRALALAEAEFHQDAGIAAAKGLGDVSVERGSWSGAQAWYARGLRLAEAAGNERWVGLIQHARGELARRRGDPGAAVELLRVARESFDSIADAHEMARVLATEGLVNAQLGLAARASAALLEALAWVHRGKNDRHLEAFIRVQIARVNIEQRRYLEAEIELRRAESLAITGSMIRRLAEIYSLLGTCRGFQGDETGFVFFEQAIALARLLDRWPMVEARVRHEYGAFKERFGQFEESRGHLERAQEIFESLGAIAELERVRSDLRRVSA